MTPAALQQARIEIAPSSAAEALVDALLGAHVARFAVRACDDCMARDCSDSEDVCSCECHRREMAAITDALDLVLAVRDAGFSGKIQDGR